MRGHAEHTEACSGCILIRRFITQLMQMPAIVAHATRIQNSLAVHNAALVKVVLARHSCHSFVLACRHQAVPEQSSGSKVAAAVLAAALLTAQPQAAWADAPPAVYFGNGCFCKSHMPGSAIGCLCR